jgi:hypothetical protein
METLRIPLLKSLETNDLDTTLELEGARFSVDRCNWPGEFPYSPFCNGRIARTDDALVVDFRVSGLDLRVQNLQDGGRSWEDSCCEIFIQAPGSAEYCNFEVNAAGKMTAARGTGRGDRVSLKPEEFGQIVRIASIEGAQDFSGGVWTWRVILLIPFELMGLDPENLPKSLRGNIYKCGDLTAHPHFLSWSPIGTPSPDFHRPEFFGEFIISE